MRYLSEILLAAHLFAYGAAGVQAVQGQAASQGRSMSINGIEMYYEEEGAGAPLLLLHDFGGCGQIWRPFRERLAQEHRLIIPDLRGHGRSTNPTGEFTHRRAALDVFALLDTLGLQHVSAMGTSSGGMTLIHMATLQPERIEALVLIGATTYFPAQARMLMEQVDPDSLSAQDRDEWGHCSSRGDAQTRDVMRQFHRMKDSYDDMNFTSPYLATITARTLIVHGDRDEYFPVDIPVEVYTSIPDAYLWIIPNGGHLPIFGTHRESFIAHALAFLKGDWAQ